jgi:hypothetical protein
MARQKSMLTLPEETARELLASKHDREAFRANVQALRSAGWTLESMAVATGYTRERIRQISNQPSEADSNLSIPSPPEKVEPYKRPVLKVSPEVLERLLELKPMAQAVRFDQTKGRVESEEYTKLIADEVARGVTIYQVAKALGVTNNAIRFRLVRYGYLEPTPGIKNNFPHLVRKVKYRAVL